MEILNLIHGSNMLYIDPAATSALLSSITAILVALGASFIVIWRKLKKKVDKTLKIDPNRHKEVEEDVVVNDQEIVKDANSSANLNNTDENKENEINSNTKDGKTKNEDKNQADHKPSKK